MPSDPQGRAHRILLVANPESRRTAAFRDAVRRLGGITVDLVSYPEVIRGRVPAALASGTMIRIESPGECAETTRAILQEGIAPLEARRRIPIRAAEIAQLPCGRGEILHPLQWYLGYHHILRRLQEEWSQPDVRWMSTPDAITTCFDKLACLNLWSAGELPIPERPAEVSTYAALRSAVPDRHARLFLKLRYGYSAMGAIALEWRDSLVRAITTVDVALSQGRPRLFVTKKPRVLHREFEIAWLIDTLGMEEILVERWLPKALWKGRPFDLRMLTIGGRVQHVVGRSSNSPFTNLNLDARRIPKDDVIELLGDAWPEAESLAERAASLLPDAWAVGIDLLVRPSRTEFALLEANAFGDYLPGLTCAGMSTYEAELRAFLAPETVPA